MKKTAIQAIALTYLLSSSFLIHAQNTDKPALETCSIQPLNPSSNKLGAHPLPQTTHKTEKTPFNTHITPPAGPLVSRGASVYLTADFLFWKAAQEGLAFGSNGSVDDPTSKASKGDVYRPHFKYEPGFKVALGSLCGNDNWSLMAEYTRLHTPTHATKKRVTYQGQPLSSTQIQASTNQLLSYYQFEDSLSGKWGLHFNVLHLEMGRNFWISKRLSLKPHIGMKFSWIKQDYTISGTEAVNPNQVGTPFSKLSKNRELDQFGVGLCGGVNTAFYLWKKWSIFGDLAWTALWNKFSGSYQSTHKIVANGPEYIGEYLQDKQFNVTGILEAALGLRFETLFSKSRYMYILQAGWENQIWFDQGQFVNRFNSSSVGNLSLEGLTIKTGFYF